LQKYGVFKMQPEIIGTQQQIQNFGDISMRDGNTLSITQIIQITAAYVQTCPLNKNSPYKGLKRFESRDADYFFGREQFIGSLIQALSENNLILLLGASGSGKSSVIRAGVIPRLAQLLGNKFCDFTFTPDKDPFDSLRSSLVNKGYKQAEVELTLEREPNIIARLIQSLKEENSQWLIFIDQFEEIFTICNDFENRTNFIESIIQIANSSDKSVKIILAMRADFLDRLSNYPQLVKVTDKDKCRPMIAEMHLDELRLAIEQPAAKNGVIYESGLVEEIIKDVQNQAGSLPLLQYTLDLLWQSDDILNRTLNIQTYRNIGGVRGALQEHVDKIYNKFTHQEQVETKKIFLRLVDVVQASGNANLVGKAVSRRALLTEFPIHNLLRMTLQKLINNNLLVSNSKKDNESNESNESTVEIAHEALISSWHRLKTWIEDAKEVIIIKNRLTDDAQRWERLLKSNNPKFQDELWSGFKLDRAVELIEQELFELVLGGLNENENKFIEESVHWRDNLEQEKEKANQRLRKSAIIATSFAVGAGIAFFTAVNQWISAEDKEKTAKSLQFATASEASLNEDTTRSLLLAIQANLMQKTPQAAQTLWQAFQKNHEQLELEHNGTVVYAEFDPSNSNRVLTVSNDKTAKVWNLYTPTKTPIVLAEHTQSINYGNFNPTNPNQLLTVSNDGTARLWDISNINKPIVISLISDGTEPIQYGRINPNNPKQVLTVSQRAAKLWDINYPQSPKVLTSLQGGKGEVWEAIFDPKNFNRLLIISNNGTVRIWNLSNPKHLITLNHEGVTNGSFDPNNPKRVLTVGSNKITHIWNLDTSSPTSIVLKGHTQSVNYGSFNPTNSNQVLTVSDDGTARLWDIKKGEEIKSFVIGQEKVIYHAFNPSNSNQFLTVSLDGKAKIWDIESSSVLFALYGHTAPIRFATFDPKNPKRVLTTSEDKTARIWDVSEKAYIEIYNRTDKKASSIIFSIFHPDFQNRILTIARDGTISNWDIDKLEENEIQQNNFGSLQDARIDPKNPNRIITINSNGIAKITTDQSVIPLTVNGRVESISFDSKNSNRILTVSNTTSTATVWNIGKNPPEKLQELTAPRSSPMNQGEFDPNNSNRVATVGGDGIVRIWNLKQPNQPEKKLPISQDQLWHVSFDPKNSNRILTMGSDKVARVWDIANNKLIAELTGHQDVVNYGSFDPNNSNRVLTISYDGTARIWDLTNPANPLILKGDNQKLFYGNFDPNNSNRVITVNSKGITRIYKIGGKDLLSLAWNNASRCFNSKEEKAYTLLNKDFLNSLLTYIYEDVQPRLSQKYRPYCKPL
jgi:WD40 repeat protein